jgi:hypothetical protein
MSSSAKINRISKWLNSTQGWLKPPGCETVHTARPGDDEGCCTVGIVHEHRFAFFYWVLYSLDKGKHEPQPVLITLDSHDDVGVPGEVDIEDLDNLSIGNRTELGLFVWTRLRRLNDGHILPALYLNCFSDVYVLMNNDEDIEDFKLSFEEQQQIDRHGNIHKVNYYQHLDQLLYDLPPDTPVFLDIDLDFFVNENPAEGSLLGSDLLRSVNFISSFLSINGPLLGSLLTRIVGLTIALEPKYCGGLLNSLHILDVLNCEFFAGTLCTHNCRWKTAK